ncbi:hypothetical protein FIBSPDRAFT_943508 [Athelia psychrophila]|uniref:Thioester reductase (TE) domain-containing protein n=1 Tax=Athelia psychrophila TaxID=1759441 RepID=A0A166VUV4_9AGAM|nr:hypothetical protein FIBSPDRAFT_943508 [Fibularhizoctonia sp. CBS 109695]
MDEVVLILHSSGSTGVPKLIPHTNWEMLGWCALDAVADIRRTSRISGMHHPPFYTTGLTFDFLIPLSSLTSVSLYLPTTRSPLCFVETWASEPENDEWLKAKDFLGFGGGPLSVKTGDALSRAGVRLVELYVPGNSAGYESATSATEEMIMKYSADIKIVAITSLGRPVDTVVLVTGTLGSYVLVSATIQDRQTNAFEDIGLNLVLLRTSKLVYVEGHSALPKLGLSDALYEELRSSVTIIIHNAWRLDFNLSLASFEPSICGTRNLANLALQSSYASTIRFMFTSSIGSTLGWDQAKGAFLEEIQMDVATASSSGYGEGKYVSERILHKSGLQASSFRIGQFSGGIPNRAWATSDWVPSMVKSSLALGALPDAQGVVA